MRDSTARINGIDIHYRLDGAEDRPLVVLSHSLATSQAMWGLQIPLLARHFRVLAYDMRGHGRTGDPQGAYSLEQLADDVAGLVAHLGYGRVHFVGLSIGGMIGQVLSIRHPRLVERLVLASTMTGATDANGAKMWDERIKLVEAKGVESQIEGTIARWLSAEFIKDAPLTTDWIRGLIRATPLAGYIGCGHAIKAMDIRPADLGNLRLPTLVMAGEHDPGATVAVAETIRSRIQGARLAVITGALHLANVEKPHDFNEVLLGFLTGTHDA
jgi:3-oxoadipate enol-lactonase